MCSRRFVRGLADVVTGAGPGGASHVKVINAQFLNRVVPNGVVADTAILGSFYVYDPNFLGGIFVSAGDMNGDGRADIQVGIGPNGGEVLKIVDGTRLNQVFPNGVLSDTALRNILFPFETSFTDGVPVGVVNTDGDDIPDLIVAKGGPLGLAEVRLFRGSTLLNFPSTFPDVAQLDRFFAFPGFNSGGFVGGFVGSMRRSRH